MTTRPAATMARAMVGEPGSRYRLPTPALIVDEAKVDANIAAMAARVGAGVELVTPHCDPTVDRYDEYHVVHGDTVVAIIPIDAARASR